MNSFRNGIGRATSATGTGETDSRIGAKEIETRIDAPMKSAEVPASPEGQEPLRPDDPECLRDHVGRPGPCRASRWWRRRSASSQQ